MVIAFGSFVTGFIVGLLFTAFKFPLPEAPVLAGSSGGTGIRVGRGLRPLIFKLL